MTLTVNVKDNNIEQALRSMKKKLQREGLFKEMKLRKHYEKPSLKKAREKEENIRTILFERIMCVKYDESNL